MVKHEKACSDHQHVFISFIFDIFDFLAPDVIDLQHKVQSVMHKNVMYPGFINIVFTMIDFAIKKHLAT